MTTPGLARPLAALLTALWAAGCGGDERPTPPADAAPTVTPPVDASAGAVFTFATFARVIDKEGRISDGLDLDGQVSGSGDTGTCNKRDFRSESGDEGIDNQFGELMPVVEPFVGTDNIGGLLAQAVASGELLNIIAVDGLDDPQNDPDVTVRVGMGKGPPLLDTTGKYIPAQTFGFDTEAAPVTVIAGARVDNGVLTASAPKLVLPMLFADPTGNVAGIGPPYPVQLTDVRMRFEVVPHPTGGVSLKGLLGGAIAIDEFQTILDRLEVDESLKATATFIISGLADMGHDPESGTCRALSAQIAVEAAPAFIHRPPAEAPIVQ